MVDSHDCSQPLHQVVVKISTLVREDTFRLPTFFGHPSLEEHCPQWMLILWESRRLQRIWRNGPPLRGCTDYPQ
ncbi:hypothetical protein Y032_0288g1487 [Ancylostoma ceylanicum]|uniref:Uncharacterized protein n=1 Tax=Ancylostoma ceylanicum TaxID=53326 RepID=A0A016S6G8_9BILA|nr:hypothetical protein Y032_0288g1487 [Ancylostoma ceylanicum]